MPEMKINLHPFTYPDISVPFGPLSNDMRAQACWTFYTRAESARRMVGKSTEDQTLLEGELWMDLEYEGIAKGVALQYGLESPSDWQPLWENVKETARYFGYPEPADEYVFLKRKL